jgi:DNA repair exonuclease SbcCD ATPase subunit
MQFIESVIGGNPFVRMELTKFGDLDSLEEDYRRILNIEGGTFMPSVMGDKDRKGILWELYNRRDSGSSADELSDLISSVKVNTEAVAHSNEEYTGYIERKFKSRLVSYTESRPEIFDHLLSWYPDDLLIVKYLKDTSSHRFAPMERGSAGQKASAILAFLLSYGDEPLILDQPEDDLDNELINTLIVSQIHENKIRRQLIIATHNPNIVVNGIAELIISLKFVAGQVMIQSIGSLAQKKVRDSVCSIMEGGRDAFDKRYKRITIGG